MNRSGNHATDIAQSKQIHTAKKSWVTLLNIMDLIKKSESYRKINIDKPIVELLRRSRSLLETPLPVPLSLQYPPPIVYDHKTSIIKFVMISSGTDNSKPGILIDLTKMGPFHLATLLEKCHERLEAAGYIQRNSILLNYLFYSSLQLKGFELMEETWIHIDDDIDLQLALDYTYLHTLKLNYSNSNS